MLARVSCSRVYAVLQHWWLGTQADAPPAEPEGPPCARCGSRQHHTAACPNFSIPRTHSCADWCRIGSLDQTARSIAESLHRVATGRAPSERLHLISNDCRTAARLEQSAISVLLLPLLLSSCLPSRLAAADSGDSGTHWFSVVTEVVRDGDESGAARGRAEREADAWDAAREARAALADDSAHAGPLQQMVSLHGLKPHSHALARFA